MTLTRDEIINSFCHKFNLSKKEASLIIDKINSNLTEKISNGEKVSIKNFGMWVVKHKKQRKVGNFDKSNIKEIPPRNVITFLASKNFKKELINKFKELSL